MNAETKEGPTSAILLLGISLAADCPAEERDDLGNCPAPKPAAPKPAAVAKVDPGIDWVRIPGGTFQMGSTDGHDDEKPMHTVRVASFELSRSEVTVGQHARCVSAGSCTTNGLDSYDSYRQAPPTAEKEPRPVTGEGSGAIPS